jgi:hypothetical protein
MAPLVGKLRVNLDKCQRGLVIAAERAQNIICWITAAPCIEHGAIMTKSVNGICVI